MHPSGPQPGWDLGLTLTGDQATMEERKGACELLLGRRKHNAYYPVKRSLGGESTAEAQDIKCDKDCCGSSYE